MVDAPAALRIHYIKSNAFRVVHADGVIGGPTPNGHLHASFYSERLPIPTVTVQTLRDVGGGRAVLGDETLREGKDGMIREVEVGVTMTLELAKKLHAWLGNHIGHIEAEMHSAANTGGSDAT